MKGSVTLRQFVYSCEKMSVLEPTLSKEQGLLSLLIFSFGEMQGN